jgi:steroid delta-isomerase-like uncharacterized protein
MSVKDNLNTVDMALEAINQRDWKRFASLHTDSFVQYSPDLAQPINGPQAVREHVESYVGAFPDVRLEKLRSFGQEDWVCLEFAFSGTHTGPMMSDGRTIPATNKPVRGQETILLRLEDGKLAEAREYFDQLGFLRQLGLAA